MPRKTKDEYRKCAYCGRDFLVDRLHKVYCSTECRETVIADRNIIYQYERRKKRFELNHPDKEFIPRPHKGRPREEREEEKPKHTFSETLNRLKAEGKDYAEEQRRKTIEMYARVQI